MLKIQRKTKPTAPHLINYAKFGTSRGVTANEIIECCDVTEKWEELQQFQLFSWNIQTISTNQWSHGGTHPWMLYCNYSNMTNSHA